MCSRPPLLTAFYSPSQYVMGQSLAGSYSMSLSLLSPTGIKSCSTPHIREPLPIPHALPCLPSFPSLGRVIPGQQRWQAHTTLGSKQPCSVARARPPGSSLGEQEQQAPWPSVPPAAASQLSPASLFVHCSSLPRTEDSEEQEKGKVVNLDQSNKNLQGGQHVQCMCRWETSCLKLNGEHCLSISTGKSERGREGKKIL